jgi:hypothetical protein
MSVLQSLVDYIGLGALGLLLLGLFRQGLWRCARAFSAYLAAIMLVTLAIRAWPGTFHSPEFYVLKECLYGLLKLAMAVEIAVLTSQAFPGAHLRARRWLAFGTLALTLALAAGLRHGTGATDLTENVLPRLANGTALLLAGVWGLILWFHLPVHPVHRAILRGLVPYLLVFTVLLSVLRAFRWQILEPVSALNNLCYMILLVYWCWVVWARPQDPPVDPALVRQLQPWRRPH